MSDKQRIGKYEVEGLIAKESDSALYRGLDGTKPVALKIVNRNPARAAALARFKQRLPLLTRLRHDSIAGLIEVVETEKALCLVYELAEGEPLEARMKSTERPNLRQAWELARQVLDSLTVAHHVGAIHGDLTPAKVFVDKQGRLKVSGFGAAGLAADTAATALYMAPEQFQQAEADVRSDLYQAGVIVYQLVSGKLPFAGTREELAQRVAQEKPADPSSHVPKVAWQLDWVIQRALSKKPADRFGTPREFIEGLRLGFQESLGTPLPVPPPPKLPEIKLPPPEKLAPAPAPAAASKPAPAPIAEKPPAPPAPVAERKPAPASKPAPVAEKKPAPPPTPAPQTPASPPLVEKEAPPPPQATAPPPPPSVAPPPAPPPPAAAEAETQKARMVASALNATAQARPARAPQPPPAEQKLRVLFVDDDERILNALRALFRTTYEVFTAESGAAALQIVRESGIQMVVSDQRMPEMTGVDLLREVRKEAPRTVRILLTGYSDLAALVGSINEGEIFRFVKKPWDNEELRATLGEAAEVAAKLFPQPVRKPQSPRSAGSLLVIDAEGGLGKGLERLLAGAAIVHTAASPREAAKLLQSTDVAAVVADLSAGKAELVMLFKLLKAKRPETLSILVADDPDFDVVAELINQSQIFRFLPKPVNARELRSHVSDALRNYAAFIEARTRAAESGLVEGAGALADSPVSRTA